MVRWPGSGPDVGLVFMRVRFTRRIALHLSLLVSLGAEMTVRPSVASATPVDLFGYGAHGPGMGMTGVSFVNDLSATYANPAGLAAMKRKSLLLGFHGGAYRVSLGGDRVAIPALNAQTFGVGVPLPFGGVMHKRITLGVAVYAPSEVLIKANILYPEVPQFPVMDRAQATALLAGVGVDLTDVVPGLRVGLSTAVYASLFGDLFVRLDETGAFSSTVESELLTRVAPVVGARWTGQGMGVGAVFRHKYEARVDLLVLSEDLPLDVPALTVGGILHYDPHVFAVEAYYDVFPELRVVANVTARLWGDFPGFQQRTSDASDVVPDPGFHHTLSPRLGVQATLHPYHLDLDLRAGWALEPSPAPPARQVNYITSEGEDGASFAMRNFDNNRQVWTLGAGLAGDLSAAVRLRTDFYLQYHWLQPRIHEVGVDDFATRSARTGGSIFVAGWTVGMEFE